MNYYFFQLFHDKNIILKNVIVLNYPPEYNFIKYIFNF